MKRLFIMLAVASCLLNCKVDVDSAIDDLVNALDDDAEQSCRTMLAKGGNGNGKGDPHDEESNDDVYIEEETEEETVSEVDEESEEFQDCVTETVENTEDTDTDIDTSGGIATSDTYDDGSDVPEFDDDAPARHFVGTFQLSNSSSCAEDYYYSAYGASAPEIPSTVRVWSNVYAGTLDFELSGGKLGWFGELYQDNTIDFTINYLNVFGQPSEQIDCTCDYKEKYYNYNTDQIDCLCEPSMINGDCTIRYNKI
jgi:hypothetical protein